MSEPYSPDELAALEAAAESNSFIGRMLATVRNRERQRDKLQEQLDEIILKPLDPLLDAVMDDTELQDALATDNDNMILRAERDELQRRSNELKQCLDAIAQALHPHKSADGWTYSPQRLAGMVEELQRQIEALKRIRDGSHELCWSNEAKQADEIAELQRQLSEHRKAVSQFLSDMYCTMIDPLAEGESKVEETCKILLQVAADQRQREDDLQRQLAEARKDTERLDWLSDYWRCKNAGVLEDVEIQFQDGVYIIRGKFSQHLREAIDAARIAQREKS